MYNGAVYFHIAMLYLLPKYWWLHYDGMGTCFTIEELT